MDLHLLYRLYGLLEYSTSPEMDGLQSNVEQNQGTKQTLALIHSRDQQAGDDPRTRCLSATSHDTIALGGGESRKRKFSQDSR